jgi:hypothetical protein
MKFMAEDRVEDREALKSLRERHQQEEQRLLEEQDGKFAATLLKLKNEIHGMYKKYEVEISRNQDELERAMLEQETGPKERRIEVLATDERGGVKKEKYATYLRKLLGKDALEGQNVFHIIANSHGGADHPDNFLYALGASFNKSIGGECLLYLQGGRKEDALHWFTAYFFPLPC